jgi:AcrR family transcriptional regulator
MAEEMAERGASAGSVTLAQLSARAGVSATALHNEFSDRDAVLLAAFDLGVERAARTVVPSYEAEARWLDGIRAGLAAFLRFVEDEPALARLIVVYALGGGAPVLRRRAQVLVAVARIIDGGRAAVPAGKKAPPEVIAEGVAGAVLAIVHNQLVADSKEPPIELFGALASIVVLPYLGSGVARRELGRPVPRERSPGETPGDPGLASAAELGTRLTYRTARVLSAIGDYPGASNREVAERAGVVDQGQISKLLGRLEGHELIEKINADRTRGAPNSWRLTERGELLRRRAGALA